MINSEESTNSVENASTAAKPSESEIMSSLESEILSPAANEIMSPSANEVVSPVASKVVSSPTNEIMSSAENEITSSPANFSSASEIMSPPANEIMSSSDIMSDDISTAEIESVISDSSSHLQQSLVDGLTSSCRDLTLGMEEVVTKVQKTLSNISAITVANVQTCGSSVASLDVTIADSCKSMYSLIASVGELDEEMAPVAELAAKVQRIKTVLTALEDNL